MKFPAGPFRTSEISISSIANSAATSSSLEPGLQRKAPPGLERRRQIRLPPSEWVPAATTRNLTPTQSTRSVPTRAIRNCRATASVYEYENLSVRSDHDVIERCCSIAGISNVSKLSVNHSRSRLAGKPGLTAVNGGDWGSSSNRAISAPIPGRRVRVATESSTRDGWFHGATELTRPELDGGRRQSHRCRLLHGKRRGDTVSPTRR